jgi:hypothetical protein
MIRSNSFTRILLVLLMVVAAVPAAAQDAHYWTNQYGTRADLLGGVVVGSIADLSSTYYNPGMLALTQDPNLVISTNAVRWTRIELENGAGEDIPLTSTKLSPAPSIMAIRLGWKPFDGQIAISYLERYRFDLDVVGRRIDSRDIAGGGVDAFSGELMSSTRLSEYWGGVSWASPKLMDGVGVGATLYGAYRGQKGRAQTLVLAHSDSSGGAAAILYDEFDFYNFRTLVKIGVSFEWDVFRLGFALTTPSVSLFGSGHSAVNAGYVVPGESGGTDSELAADYQPDLDAYFSSPLSIAGGLSYRFGENDRSAVHFTTEYFSRQEKFAVLDPEPFTSQTTGEVIDRKFTHEGKPVLNWGVGFEFWAARNVTFYGAYITDYSYRPDDVDPAEEISLSNWNIQHVSFGSAFTVSGLDFTVGLSYGWGLDRSGPPVDFSDPGTEGLQNPDSQNDFSYQSLKALIGFAFPL